MPSLSEKLPHLARKYYPLHPIRDLDSSYTERLIARFLDWRLLAADYEAGEVLIICPKTANMLMLAGPVSTAWLMYRTRR